MAALCGVYRQISFACEHYSGQAAVVQKIKALAGRAQTQARDVFDLFVLHLGGHVSREAIRSRCSSSEREKAAQALSSLD